MEVAGKQDTINRKRRKGINEGGEENQGTDGERGKLLAKQKETNPTKVEYQSEMGGETQ